MSHFRLWRISDKKTGTVDICPLSIRIDKGYFHDRRKIAECAFACLSKEIFHAERTCQNL